MEAVRSGAGRWQNSTAGQSVPLQWEGFVLLVRAAPGRGSELWHPEAESSRTWLSLRKSGAQNCDGRPWRGQAGHPGLLVTGCWALPLTGTPPHWLFPNQTPAQLLPQREASRKGDPWSTSLATVKATANELQFKQLCTRPAAWSPLPGPTDLKLVGWDREGPILTGCTISLEDEGPRRQPWITGQSSPSPKTEHADDQRCQSHCGEKELAMRLEKTDAGLQLSIEFSSLSGTGVCLPIRSPPGPSR